MVVARLDMVAWGEFPKSLALSDDKNLVCLISRKIRGWPFTEAGTKKSSAAQRVGIARYGTLGEQMQPRRMVFLGRW